MDNTPGDILHQDLVIFRDGATNFAKRYPAVLTVANHRLLLEQVGPDGSTTTLLDTNPSQVQTVNINPTEMTIKADKTYRLTMSPPDPHNINNADRVVDMWQKERAGGPKVWSEALKNAGFTTKYMSVKQMILISLGVVLALIVISVIYVAITG